MWTRALMGMAVLFALAAAVPPAFAQFDCSCNFTGGGGNPVPYGYYFVDQSGTRIGSVCFGLSPGCFTSEARPTYSAQLNANGRYDIVVNFPSLPFNASPTVTIRGTSAFHIGRIIVNNSYALFTIVSMRGPTSLDRIGSVGQISRGTSPTGSLKIVVTECNTIGHVGLDAPQGQPAFDVDQVNAMNIGGNVYGGIRALRGAIGDVVVAGSVFGDVIAFEGGGGPGGMINRLDVGGAITGLSSFTRAVISASVAVKVVRAGSLYSDISTNGPVQRIQTTAGDFDGSLTANTLEKISGTSASDIPELRIAGNLRASIIANSYIGIPIIVGGAFNSTRAIFGDIIIENEISSARGLYNGGIFSGQITVADDLAGRISMGTPTISGTTSLNGPVSVGGDLTGELILADGMSADVNVVGTIVGAITVNGDVNSGRTIWASEGLDGVISVGKSLAGTIALPSGGLRGQVVVNAANDISVWNGAVSVGEHILSTSSANPSNVAPYYLRKSADLGNGAVGLAPFHLYEDDCTPPNNRTAFGQGVLETAFTPPSSPTLAPVVAKIRHYGPIQLADPDNMTWDDAVTYECQPLNGNTTGVNCSNWREIGGLFTVHGPNELGVTDANSIGLSRVANTYPRPGLYRVILNEGAIVCAGVTGNPPVVWPTSCIAEFALPAFVFRITPDCDRDLNNDEIVAPTGCTTQCDISDFNHNGSTSVQDLFDFLAAWFSVSHTAPCGTNCAADVNHSGMVTVQDLFDFLGAWFSCN